MVPLVLAGGGGEERVQVVLCLKYSNAILIPHLPESPRTPFCVYIIWHAFGQRGLMTVYCKQRWCAMYMVDNIKIYMCLWRQVKCKPTSLNESHRRRLNYALAGFKATTQYVWNAKYKPNVGCSSGDLWRLKSTRLKRVRI